MPTEFELVFEEFDTQLQALTEVATASNGPQSTPKARIAAANAAILLLAATFEEFIRQEVKATFKEKAIRAKGIQDFPNKLVGTVWKRAFEKLSRTSLDEIETGTINIDNKIASILSFCLKKEVLADVGDIVSHNDNNMRHSQLNALFNGIGLQNFCANTCESAELTSFLGCDSPSQAAAELQSKLDGFFRKRNEIAHAIGVGSSSGLGDLLYDIEFFRIFGKAIFQFIEKHLTLGSQDGKMHVKQVKKKSVKPPTRGKAA